MGQRLPDRAHPAGAGRLSVGPPDSAGRASWLLACAALALPALLLAPVPLDQPASQWPPLAQQLTLHPDRGLGQPLHTLWTAAWLHGSASHRALNLGAMALLAWMGWLAALPRAATVGLLVAWPLTQLGLLLQPDPIAHYVGLSGVVHAGVAVVCTHSLTAIHPRFPRTLAAAVLLGLVAKLIMENPVAHRLAQPSGSDITVVPWVHLSGVMAGVLCALPGALGCRRAARQARTAH